MFFEIITLLEYWYYRFICTRSRRSRISKVHWVIFLVILSLILYGLRYIFVFTPLPVYFLDKLHLRRLFLPSLECDNCNNFAYRYIIENKDACADQDVFLLTFVTSFHANVEARNVMRRTWAGVKEYKGYKLKTLFMFGTHTDKNLNNQTFYEQNLHGDIVQADFLDMYSTLSNKSSMALRWVVEHCPQAKYIMKTDDDSFNVPQRMVDYLIQIKDEKFFGGYCFTVMPDRRLSSKFYIPESTYPDLYYPTYCSGPGYVLSQGAARDVVAVANNVRFIPMEDVFVTGMCRVVAGHQYTQIPGVLVGQDQMTPCNFATWVKNGHNIVPERASMLWEKVKVADPDKDCVNKHLVIYVVIALIFFAAWMRYLLRVFKRCRASTDSQGRTRFS